MKGFFKSRLVLTCVTLVLLASALAVALLVSTTHSRPALAYGKENWQIGFAGTGVFPATGVSFGFWGWCAFGGGVTSGNNGDCELSQYVHAPSGSVTCQESIDISSWTGSSGTFVVTGTAMVHPTSLTGPCLAIFPGSASFSGLDTGVPAMPGHFNLGSIGGIRGEFQIQVAQIP